MNSKMMNLHKLRDSKRTLIRVLGCRDITVIQINSNFSMEPVTKDSIIVLWVPFPPHLNSLSQGITHITTGRVLDS